MAKKTQRRGAAARVEKDQLGCMWGFMNMFSFRHGPLSHKLLLDQKHATGDHKNKELDKSKNRDNNAQETNPGNVTITIIKPSVKKLIAEELFNENGEAGQLSDSELEGRRRKNNRRKNKTRKKSFGSFSQINTIENEETQRSETSLDIDNMIDEFYSQSCTKNEMMKHNKHGDYKEKLRELVKFLISQKQVFTSKDLIQVFQILGSDEELFFKLLQDPKILVSRDSQRLLEQSSLTDTRKDASSQEVINDKDCDSSDRIFILKPSFSSPDIGNKVQNERNSSSFFLSEITRKLKQAIRKEQPGLQREGGFPRTKDHFFFERMAKPSRSQKKSHNVLQDDDKKQRVSNIYTEAKKHLSEMLNNGDLDSSNTKSRQVERTLGRILSFPEYLSPLSSPGRRWEMSLTTHKKSASADFVNVVNIKKETHGSQPENAVENADIRVCDLTKEPAENSVEIEDGTTASADDDVMIINEIDKVPEETISTLDVDLSKVEALDEQRDSIISKQTSNEESQPSMSSSIATSSYDKSEEWSSPISVLEPLFIEDDISPSKMRSQSGEEEPQVQPWCIHFDEQDSTRENSIETITSDKDLVFKYVKAILTAIDSDFQELYLKTQFSDQLLEPALISNIPFYPNKLCPDHELLFDCINEVLMELCCFPPWTATPKTRVFFFSTVKTIIHEVQESVYWHLSPLPLPHALDQIVRKDMVKAGNWLDIKCDIDCIGFESSELILDELLEELILSCLNNTEDSLVSAELRQVQVLKIV